MECDSICLMIPRFLLLLLLSILAMLRLLPILSRSFPEVTFIDQNAPLDTRLFDNQVQLGSLPIIMNMQPNMVGRRVPYLLDNDVLTKALQNSPDQKKLLKCGVAWKSNNQKLGKNKSIL